MARTTRTLVLAVICTASVAAVLPAEAEAQRRAVRRPSGRSVVVISPRVRAPLFYRPAFFHPWRFHPAFYGGFYSPYSWAWYPQYPYPPYGWHRPVYDRTGSARLQVTPRTAEVYVDGYFVGVVDDFDGVLQRLHVPAGEHEIVFHLEGYRTIRQKALFRPGATLKMTFTMQPLGPGEQSDPRPSPDPNARARHDPSRRQYGRAPQAGFGALSLRVQPEDAVVLIDGEEWDRPEGEDQFLIDLPEGPHRLEVRKDGFRTYMRTIEIRRGQTITLNVSLTGGRAVPVLGARFP